MTKYIQSLQKLESMRKIYRRHEENIFMLHDKR